MKVLLSRSARGLAELPLELVRAGTLLLATGSAVGALLALGGGLSRLLDAFRHFALLGLYASLACAALSLLFNRGRGRTPLVLALAGALLWLYPIAPDALAGLTARRAPADGEMLKIVQFNLWGANDQIEKTAAWIRAQNADVVIVEEATDSSLRIVRAVQDLYPYATGCRDPYPCSTLILTHTAPQRSGGYAIPFGRANLAWVEMAGAGGPFAVVGVHHSWPYPVGAQSVQSPWTVNIVRQFDQANVILTGDFNSTPWSHALRSQDRALHLERRDHAMPTFPARLFDRRPFSFPFPVLPLDHVYAGSAWKTVSVKRGPALGSDHYPVVVTLRR